MCRHRFSVYPTTAGDVDEISDSDSSELLDKSTTFPWDDSPSLPPTPSAVGDAALLLEFVSGAAPSNVGSTATFVTVGETATSSFDVADTERGGGGSGDDDDGGTAASSVFGSMPESAS